MELMALCKPIKKPPRSDERDGELFCGTIEYTITATSNVWYNSGAARANTNVKFYANGVLVKTLSIPEFSSGGGVVTRTATGSGTLEP